VSAAAVSAAALAKRFATRHGEGVWALDDVSFAVAPGECLGIVGENGSGKSTLLDLLLGVSRPTRGELHVEQPAAALLELGAGFFADLSGRDNAVLHGRLAGLTGGAARERAQAAGEFAELGAFFDRPVRSYSAGMLMRLGFALATAVAAPVTLVDEVLAVGDGYFQRRCIDRLLERRRDGGTLVVASHDLHALRALCDRALWLRHGRVQALGEAREVIGRYEEYLRARAAGEALTPGRRGTGEVTIRDVRLEDAEGRARSEIATGETFVVRVRFEAHAELDSPVMGVALFAADGVCVSGPNTRADGVLGGRYHGRYELKAVFEELPLLPGAYEASVAFYDRDHVYAYAWDHRLYPFRVGGRREDQGLVGLRHRFEVSPLDAGEP